MDWEEMGIDKDEVDRLMNNRDNEHGKTIEMFDTLEQPEIIEDGESSTRNSKHEILNQ
jgi:hypothetical protein